MFLSLFCDFGKQAKIDKNWKNFPKSHVLGIVIFLFKNVLYENKLCYNL